MTAVRGDWVPGKGDQRGGNDLRSGITFFHPGAFWVGCTALVAGVILHLPEYVRAGVTQYRMAGMPMSGIMLLGMVLIVGGTTLAAYGVLPRATTHPRLPPAVTQADGFHARGMDDAAFTAAHWRLASVLGIALVVAVMKPATLGFVIPGSIAEYGLTTGQVAILPLFALTGTTVGCLLWGMLADRLGRRAAILLAWLMFIGTAACGAMPAFGWNVLMCFFMGVSAGGMLPIVFALLAETMPAKQRGWLTVLLGGLGTAGGYLAASWAADLLEPRYGWRALWLLGLPTGALLIALNRFIPESPRFLLLQGKFQEARRVMETFGTALRPEDLAGAAPSHSAEGHLASLSRLFRGPYRNQTMSLGMLGGTWGLVNWGFLTWLPTILRDKGVEADLSNAILARSALIAVPGTLLVAWLYGHWSSKKSIVLFALATAAVLLGFATLNVGEAGSSGRLMLLVVGLLVSTSGVISMLSPYSAEIYPTHLRGIGAGLAAASSQVAGIVAPWLVAGVVALWPGLTVLALVVAGPIAGAALTLSLKGIETRGRRLEDVHAVPPSAARSLSGEPVFARGGSQGPDDNDPGGISASR